LGREIRTPVVFQGGVAFNHGMVRAFKEALETEDVVVPLHHEAMGAIGAALLALEEMTTRNTKTEFKGFEISEAEYKTSPFECHACPNLCEMAQISLDGQVIARCGGRCDMWERKPAVLAAGA
jgi:predicted NodU family carbamoyl transferase